MAMYDGHKSDKSGSTSARAGENGLDRAASKVFATSVAATMARLQLYKNHGADGSKSDESGSRVAGPARTASTALPPRYSRRASPRRWRGSSSTRTTGRATRRRVRLRSYKGAAKKSANKYLAPLRAPRHRATVELRT